MTTRHNSFYLIHKALRVAMYEMATALQQADFTDVISAEATIQQVEELLMLFESHAHGEDHFFNEPLEAKEPAIAKLFEKEHEEDHRLANVLQQLTESWRVAITNDQRLEYGRLLCYAFNEFVAFNLYHMNKEEMELNEALWRHYTDEQILATEQVLVSQIPPDKMMKYAHWLVRGLSVEDLVGWLKPIQQNAPAPVFDALVAVAKEQLPAARYDLLTQRLAVPEAVSVL